MVTAKLLDGFVLLLERVLESINDLPCISKAILMIVLDIAMLLVGILHIGSRLSLALGRPGVAGGPGRSGLDAGLFL